MFTKDVSSIPAPRGPVRLGARSLGLSAAIAGLALTIFPVHALASEGCPSVPLSQPFSSFNDTNWYELVPSGDFEGSASGWTLSGGAVLASGSEPYAVTGKLGNNSLELPKGATATAPYVCVDKTYRTMR